jgi:hypothetical protein
MHAVEHEQRKPECTEQRLKEQIEPFAPFHLFHLRQAQERPQHGHGDHETQERKEGDGNKGDDRFADADIAAHEQHGGDEKQRVSVQASIRWAGQLAL